MSIHLILKNSRATVRENPQCVEFKSSWEKRQDCMFWRNWRSYSVEYYLNWWTSSNIISTNFRLIPEINYCFFISTRRGKSFPHYFQALSSMTIKFYLNVLNFLVNDMIRIRLGFFISESVKHQFTVPNTKKQLTKISVLMPFLWKKFWVQGRVFSEW